MANVAFEFPNIEGWIRPDEGEALFMFCKGKDVLEIGSLKGLSTVCIAQSARSVVCVDPFDARGTPLRGNDTRAEFDANILRHGVADRVTVRQGTSGEVLPQLIQEGQKFDAVFVDGDHERESVASDITFSLHLLRPKGLMIFHDYRDNGNPGVRCEVDRYIERQHPKELGKVHSILVLEHPA